MPRWRKWKRRKAGKMQTFIGRPPKGVEDNGYIRWKQPFLGAETAAHRQGAAVADPPVLILDEATSPD